MGIEKMSILTHESIYWINMNTNIENAIKNCLTCLDFQQMQSPGRNIHHTIPGKP